MSILLVDPPEALGEAVVRQLVDDGDEVRIVERNRSRYDAWRALGAHVALGDSDDDDLIERAALNVRTLVLLDCDNVSGDKTETVVAAARRSGVDRVVATIRKTDRRIQQSLDGLKIQYVVLVTKRRLIGASLEPDLIARAVSAADDLAGEPRVTVDLTDPAGWDVLRLPVP